MIERKHNISKQKKIWANTFYNFVYSLFKHNNVRTIVIVLFGIHLNVKVKLNELFCKVEK